MQINKSLREIANNKEKKMTERQISVISSAIEIFSEKGYQATTTSEIAKKAKVAEGTIFRYYKTKKDLLLAMPEYLAEISLSKEFFQDIEKILDNPGAKFEDFLRAVIENRKKFAYANISLIKVLFQEIPFYPELRDKISQTILFPVLEKLTAVIDKFKAQGQIIDIPSRSVVNFMFTSLFGFFFSKYIAGLQLKWDENDEEHLIRYIMNGVCNKPV